MRKVWAPGEKVWWQAAALLQNKQAAMNLRSGTVVGAHILKPEHRPAFEEGVRQIFIRWTALCLAIENEWGGANSREKASQLVEEITEWFYRKKGACGTSHAAQQCRCRR